MLLQKYLGAQWSSPFECKQGIEAKTKNLEDNVCRILKYMYMHTQPLQYALVNLVNSIYNEGMFLDFMLT